MRTLHALMNFKVYYREFSYARYPNTYTYVYGYKLYKIQEKDYGESKSLFYFSPLLWSWRDSTE